MRAFAVIALVALAACSPKPVAKPPPMEPFGAVAIRGTTLTLTRPDQPIVIATAPGAVIQPNQASWTGKTSDGRELKITLYASICSDGMSDHVYPYTAEVDVPGASPLSGCADTVASLAKGPKP